MSDYFDRVEQGMSEAVRRGAHLPWYVRLRPQPSRPVVVVLACLVATGSALAATGALRTGEPVGAMVMAVPDAQEGVAIPGSAHLLALRVADPGGGPPWGLRVERTTRGLTCVQLGRIVDRRIGVLGQDGAFSDDRAFHPLSVNFLNGSGCATQDAHGNAFLNVQIRGLPASALFADQHVSGGCYQAPPSPQACSPSDLRDVSFGLLGPDATSITHVTQTGGTATSATAGSDGAYLVVLTHNGTACTGRGPYCAAGRADATEGPGLVVARGGSYSTGSPELESSEVIRTVSYRGAATCLVPTPAQAAQLQHEHEAPFRPALQMRYPDIYRTLYHDEQYVPGSIHRLTEHQLAQFQTLRLRYVGAGKPARCAPVGYSAPKTGPVITPTELASPISVHTEPARSYCDRLTNIIPCEHTLPKGYTRINMGGEPPDILLVIGFTARVAVRNFDSHYEINTTDPNDPANPQCPGHGAGTFGPTETNLHAGQHVRYTMFINPQCRGISHITVGFVTVNGPSGATPVPGLPGQSAGIPVGQTNFSVP